MGYGRRGQKWYRIPVSMTQSGGGTFLGGAYLLRAVPCRLSKIGTGIGHMIAYLMRGYLLRERLNIAVTILDNKSNQ